MSGRNPPLNCTLTIIAMQGHQKPPYAIGSVSSLSGHAIAYRWRSLPRVRRHRASNPQGSSKRVIRLSFPHPLLGKLKVTAIIYGVSYITIYLSHAVIFVAITLHCSCWMFTYVYCCISPCCLLVLNTSLIMSIWESLHQT